VRIRATTPVLLLALLLSAGCASAEYAGIHYPRTESVDIYFHGEPIAHPHEVMGLLRAEGRRSFQELEEELVEEARILGADAAVLRPGGGSGPTAAGEGPGSGAGPSTGASPRYILVDGELRREGRHPRWDDPAYATPARGRVLTAQLLHYLSR